MAIPRVGLIGVGRMGRSMGKHLLDAGFSLATYDVRSDAARQLVAAGATAESSPAAVAAISDVMIVMVGFPNEVERCVLGDDGLLAGAVKGSVIAVASTTSPTQMQRLERVAAERGVDVIDAPVARGEPAADRGDLLWFIGGSAEALETARPVLAACGPDIHHVGGIGAGQVGKAINNMLLWAAVCSNREGLELASAFKVDEAALRTALLDSSAASWAMAHWEMMDRTPWAHKDMVITMEMADEAGLSLPLAGLLRERVKDRWADFGVVLAKPSH